MFNIKNIHDIPTLPVPELQETYETFLRWIKPLVTHEEYEDAKTKFEEFIASDGGNRLQAYLVEKAKDKDESWLYEWWMRYGYLSSRGPVTTECNAPITLKFTNQDNYNPLQKMAVMFNATAEKYLYVYNNGAPEFKVKDKHVSLDQLHTAYCSIRNPKKNVDEFYLADEFQTHSVLQYKNRIFKIPVIENGQPISVGKIYKLLNDIVNSNVELLDVAFGHITSYINRDEMADTMDELLQNETNKNSYKVVADAIILISYDEDEYATTAETLKALVHGKDYNRFHGKTLTFICTQNDFGIIADHTPIDGGTELVVGFDAELKFKDNIVVEEEDGGLAIEEVQFELTPEQEKTLENSLVQFRKYIENIGINITELKGITRGSLKEIGILSADGFAHLAFQLAQLDAWGKIRNTYIAVDVRNFFMGRTECVRPVSDQSMAAIEALKGGKDKAETKELISEYLNEHYKRIKLCQAGKGINRHMLGLQLAQLENPELAEYPAVFDTAAWKVISGNPISTSSIFAPITNQGFFEPVDPEGIGVVYVIDNVGASYISVSAYANNFEGRDKFAESAYKWMKNIIEIFKE